MRAGVKHSGRVGWNPMAMRMSVSFQVWEDERTCPESSKTLLSIYAPDDVEEALASCFPLGCPPGGSFLGDTCRMGFIVVVVVIALGLEADSHDAERRRHCAAGDASDKADSEFGRYAKEDGLRLCGEGVLEGLQK